MLGMKLRALEDVWDRLGRADPYWAAVTWEGKDEGRWSVEDFFANGVEEIAVVFRAIEQHGWTVARRRALDFGCGPGRLTQALAERFESVDGIDIAASMIELARGHNRHGDRCRYHHNTVSDLRCFPDDTFDFVYSTLVLQHMLPRDAIAYVREMLRVAAPGGLVVFQLPTHRGEAELPPGATQTLVREPLPRGGFEAEIVPSQTAIEAQAGSALTLEIVVRNRSPHAWPSLSGPDHRFAIQIGNRWRSAAGALRKADDARMGLPYDLAPGQEARIVLQPRAPEIDGEHDIEIDAVQEGVAWFHERGRPAARVRCRVHGGRPAPEEAPPRLGARYPRLRGALVALGLDRARGAYRRLLKWREARRRPRMAMYCVPRAEMIAVVESCGGQILAVDRRPLPDGFQNGLYWVRVP